MSPAPLATHHSLGFGSTFAALYAREGLVALDARFLAELQAADVALFNRLVSARATPEAFTDKEYGDLILAVAPHLEDFLVQLFGIEKEARALTAAHQALGPLYACKRQFVQRRAAKAYTREQAAAFDGEALRTVLSLSADTADAWELAFARQVMAWLDTPQAHTEALDIAARYTAWALYTEAGQHAHAKGVLFKLPKKTDPLHLIPVETEFRDGVTVRKLPSIHHRHREGFALTDPGGTLREALDHAHYCIFCAHQGKDSCAKGMRASPPPPPQTGEVQGEEFKKDALGVTLTGCPLEERISEMNELKAAGIPLGALAAVVIDNPLCAGTGHRICNDCMKSCIYQKQEPVNIPLTETRTLEDVLSLPYGFEIYSLLTRWNPLHLIRPLPKPETDYKVLVAGLGPAGYTLSHHLLNDGHTVVAIDGLKIEPLDPVLSGVDAKGVRVPFAPIKDIRVLYESLEQRTLAGFGGVAEYGITVRWNKNYLKIIRLLLERRAQFSMTGGVRFGAQITYESAFAQGFDHIALCLGAGKPTLLDIPNGLARGVRTASDFLMSLQLTGAGKEDSIANLQLRLPVVVIGGGLTAIDTATEALAYYPVQVEKFLSRYEVLAAVRGEEAVQRAWTEEDREIAEEFIAHAKALRKERADAAREGRSPDLLALLTRWGGVTIAYRKRLTDAPSYRLNHEEMEKAFQEGITFAENLTPQRVEVDRWGHVSGIRMLEEVSSLPDHRLPTTDLFLPARTVLIAAGTNPNTTLAREDAAHFHLDGRYFQAVDANGNPVAPVRTPKPEEPQVLMSVELGGRAVSFFGDLHPSYAGNVVKAMASAKQGYPVITRALEKKEPQSFLPFSFINAQLRATVHAVQRLTPTIVEVIVHAPLAAAAFRPGQFYRLQNYEANALKMSGVGCRLPEEKVSCLSDTRLAMEGLAMTGAWVDKEKGLISVIVLEMGGSSDLCAYVKPGEPVVLMGPTGSPTHIPAHENVLLAGGGLGNAVLFSIGKAMRAAGSRVLYFAGYRQAIDRYKTAEIEAAADHVVWCCDERMLPAHRPQDKTFHGTIVDAMRAYAEGTLGDAPIAFPSLDRILAIGSAPMMAAVAAARRTVLAPYLKPDHAALGSINSPMQCMMKEICAQCLQKHIDPATGKETYVYSCFNQDQCLDVVSFPDLEARLAQNRLQEKLTAHWVDFCLKTQSLRP